MTLEIPRDAVRGLKPCRCTCGAEGSRCCCHLQAENLGEALLSPTAAQGKPALLRDYLRKVQCEWRDLQPLPQLFQLDPRSITFSGRELINLPWGAVLSCLSVWHVANQGKLHQV